MKCGKKAKENMQIFWRMWKKIRGTNGRSKVTNLSENSYNFYSPDGWFLYFYFFIYFFFLGKGLTKNVL